MGPDHIAWSVVSGMHIQAHRKHFLSGTATGEGSVGSGNLSAWSTEKFFHLHFSVFWIGSRSTFVLCTALPRLYLAMGQGGQLPPRLGNWLQSIIKYYLFIAASYWAIIDLPASLSCFSQGFACPTSSLANSIICACANLCWAKNRSGRSGCYGPD